MWIEDAFGDDGDGEDEDEDVDDDDEGDDEFMVAATRLRYAVAWDAMSF